MKTLRILPALLLGAALAGCPTAPKPDPIPPSPKIVRFTATPASVAPGGEVTLEWEVTDATKVTIDDVNKGALSGVDDRLTGTVKVVPTESTLYVITALNDRGAKATTFASVTVSGADASKLVFAAYPQLLPTGETGSLVWSAPGARVVSITPMGGAALDLGGQLESGSVAIDPTATETTYTLDADGQTRTVKVTRGVAITEFTLSKPVAQPDDMITLSWKTAHATKVTLSTPGVGPLHETTTAAEVAMGSHSLAVPTVPTGTVLNYLLDAQGPGGTLRQIVSLVVGKDPVITEVTAPQYVKTGSTFTISWKAANADVVEVRTGGATIYQTTDFSQVASGSVRLTSPSTMTTYTVAAVALPSGLAATKDVTVDPVGDVTVNTFTVAPTSVATGGDPVTLTWNVPNARQLRIEQDGELTVVWKTGAAAEQGTATVYPNRATTVFTLTATNTIDPAQTASGDAGVTTVVEMTSYDGGVIFQGASNVDLGLPVGSEVHGLPLSSADAIPSSTGFDDISMTGTKLTFTNTDDGYAQFAVPGFETFLYGNRLVNGGSVTAGTNGYLALRAVTTTTGTPPSPFPGTSTTYDNFLAPFWANLELGPNGAVYWQVKGEAPNRVLIVQWDKVRLVGTAASVLTFQAQVTQTGVITYEYQTLSGLPATYTSATGLQGTSGRGLTASPAAGAGLRFFGPKAPPISFPSAALPASGFVKIGSGFTKVAMTRFVRAGEFGISEVMYSPASTVPAGEWFEVYNSSTQPIDLNGFEIDFGGGNVHTIAASVVVPPSNALVLGQSTDPTQNDGVTVAYAYGPTFAMDDTAGSVTLRSGPQQITSSWTAAVGGTGISAVTDTRLLLGSTGAYNVPIPPCSASPTQTYGSQTPLQRGTPGVLTTCFPRLSTIPVSYTEIATTGTLVGFTSWDEQTRTLDISSAPILLRGASVSTLSISTNGWIIAGTTTTTELTNKTVPTTSAPLGTLAVFWDDLNRKDTTGNIYYQRFAAGADPANPAPHWVIEWKNYTHYNANDTLDFQAKLFDDGSVEYHYATMISGSSANYANGNSATIWMENTAGTGALPFSINQPNITPNMAVRYTP